MGSMTHSKQAVDSTAVDYWTNYFGPYGKQWVREISRKVKACVDKHLGRKVAAATDEGHYPVRALGKAITKEGVVLEGAVRAPGGDLLFRAAFNHEGHVTSFEAA